ncbi:hypothetical protein V8F20_005560 [Naviculisporaceae sp. PSN 640]
MPMDFKFMGPHQQGNAKRKPDEVWEELKDTILGYYHENTLEKCMRYMDEQHNFRASKRQYIHRLGKWGVRKYKPKEGGDDGDDHEHSHPAPARRKKPSRPEPRPSHTTTRAGPSRQSFPDESASVAPSQGHHLNPYDDPSHDIDIDPYLLNMNPSDAASWYSLLANTLDAIGDSPSAFQIQAALYDHSHEVSLAMICARSAQGRKQVDKVRGFIEEAINICGAPEISWDRFIFGAQLARGWVQVGERENGLEQFADMLVNYIDLSHSRFKQQLDLRRSPGNLPYHLDILAYIHLRGAILSFNKDDLNFTDGEPELDVEYILHQFLLQQPVYNGATLSCLHDCLAWCVEHLERNSALLKRGESLPIDLKAIPGDSVYKVVCLLWTTWVQGLRQRQAYHPQWSIQAEEQLSISPPELLILVVCTIMATPLANGRASFDSEVADALRRARNLLHQDAARPGDFKLLEAFLIQVHRTADQRMAAWEDLQPAMKATDFDAIREVLGASMPAGYKLPPRHQGYIHPLIVGDSKEDEAVLPTQPAMFPPSPSLSLF